MITDGVFCLIGTSPVVELVARDAPAITGDAFPAFIGARPTCACAAGHVGDAFLAFIGAPPGSAAPVRVHCTSGGAWHQG